jgi:dTDP-4-amino-4,6-dideoxygalactose transaminase
MRTIKRIANKYNLTVIEDACHALGGKYKNSKIGDCKYSDMSVFSFHPVKAITTGEGGAITTNSKLLYEELLLLRSHGVKKDKAGKNVMTELGYNYRLTDIQAALGMSQLKRIDNFIKKRQMVTDWYQQELKNIDNIVLPEELSSNYSAWHIYVIRTKRESDRDKLAEYLSKNGVGINFHYPAVYSHLYYRKHGYKNVKLKNTEEYKNTCLTLPCHTILTHRDISFISVQIKNYYKKRAR